MLLYLLLKTTHSGSKETFVFGLESYYKMMTLSAVLCTKLPNNTEYKIKMSLRMKNGPPKQLSFSLCIRADGLIVRYRIISSDRPNLPDLFLSEF